MKVIMMEMVKGRPAFTSYLNMSQIKFDVSQFYLNWVDSQFPLSTRARRQEIDNLS